MGKRFRRCASSSSPQKVVLNDDDLLTLILLHVPWKNLISLKCVSRQWLSLITTFHFRNLLPPRRASGLFIQAPYDTFIDVSSPNEVYFVSLDDPNKAFPFKTRVFENEHDDHKNIRILQSCNGLLLCSNVPDPGMYFNDGVYWNGCMHWLSTLHRDLEPDSSVSVCLYINVDKERLGTFLRPLIGEFEEGSLYFGESECHLHVIEACPWISSLNIYEMKIKVFSLIIRENFNKDSFLVLEIPGKFIRYNLMDKNFKLIWDFGVDLDLDPKINDDLLFDFQVCQYIKSLSCV
ncbi:hypothetical protein POM88_024384 [Heracleum sosnowskyi]|uniref:F-box domain-containing protein n=1 Tax=Heracleum sosnowskyi TaxID=360622 RepID=A0AAD8MIU9_9APIA|nr:hypothetical protein POM88_024384 [Heracleum sosnowskyi]